MKKHLTFKDSKSDKFWNIEVKGKSFTVVYGKNGTNGTTQVKSFKSDYECKNEAEKLVKEKIKKGYAEQSDFQLTTEAIKQLLKSDKLIDIENGILHFSHHILNSASQENPVYSFFELNKSDYDDSEMIEIDVLDAALSRFEKQLSSESLIRIIESTLSFNICDNFKAAKIAITIAIKRKDITVQNAAVESFKSACKFYDAGHRLNEGTLQDVPVLMRATTTHSENAVVRDAIYGLGHFKAVDAVPVIIEKLKTNNSIAISTDGKRLAAKLPKYIPFNSSNVS